MDNEKFQDKSNTFNIACIIMASGSGSRFGGCKLLAPLAGRPLLAYALQATAGLFAARAVITRSSEIAALCGKENVPCLLHAEPGQNDTVRLGISETKGCRPDGYIFCVGDQPLLKRSTLEALCRAFCREPQYIWRTASGSRPGNPVVFPARMAGELMQLPRDKGGSYLAKKYPELVRTIQVQDICELYDVDTADDLEHLQLLVSP